MRAAHRRKNTDALMKHAGGVQRSPKVRNTPPAKQLTSDSSQVACAVSFRPTGTSTPMKASTNRIAAAVHFSQVYERPPPSELVPAAASLLASSRRPCEIAVDHFSSRWDDVGCM